MDEKEGILVTKPLASWMKNVIVALCMDEKEGLLILIRDGYVW
jgi:hypothetical protein